MTRNGPSTQQGSGLFFGRRRFHFKRLPLKETPDACRAGVVLVAVLVALLVVMLISAAIVRGLVVQHRLATTEQEQLQAFWFAESAVQRARVQLEANAEYRGESWRVELPQIGNAKCEALIRVEPIENELNKRTIIIEARWPNDPIDGVLQQRTIVVERSIPADES